ncbi:MAG: proline dehydrogenase family protein [Bradymonadia bacterium]
MLFRSKANLESRIQAIGEQLFAEMKGETPGLFNKAWWSGQVLEWAMKDEGFKTEMFRFVDVFPVLQSPEEIARHIQEYLLRPGVKPPAVIKMALKGAGLGKMATKVAAGQIAKNLEGMAKRFIVGTDAESALSTLKQLRDARQGFTVDLLGEATVSEAEAEAYAAKYLALIEGLADACADWTQDETLERDDKGLIPRVNVSVKVSAMYSQLSAEAFDHSVERASARLLPLFQAARRRGVFLNVDMEQFAYKDLTYAIFKQVMSDPSLEGWSDAGVVVQAYLRSAEADTRDLVQWAKRSGKRITIRLVKGAYWDYETVKAHQEGWASPVWLHKGDTDACFERCAELLLKNHKHLKTAIGSHNVRSLAHAMAIAEREKLPKEAFEVQCLYGMAEPIKAACVNLGYRVRVYAPVGDLIPGMAYLVRRLLENTSNQSWLRMGFVEAVDTATLLAKPEPVDADPMLRGVPGPRTLATDPGEFVNEPLRELTEAPQRAAIERALQQWTPLKTGAAHAGSLVGGSFVLETGRQLTSIDPADGQTIVGTVAVADVALAQKALDHAAEAFPGWRDTPAAERAQVLFDIAADMRAERDAWIALILREVGKARASADADVCEAIDFLEYYGREMMRLDVPRLMQDLPGETNHLGYIGRGPAVVIAPWNFPLAILTGMTAAALVTGNPTIVKPAEQSAVIGARFTALVHSVMRKHGAHPGVFQCIQGYGEEVGAALVADPRVATVLFTGSRAVGLEIWRQCGITGPDQMHLKRVVCEMGGKNAIIVDGDADLDEAVLGVVSSAFGFAGQKCSACSRVIVLEEHHDAFVERLVEATKSLHVGPPTDPACHVGPVIDTESRDRLQAAIEAADGYAERRVGGVREGAGFFIEPTIFTGVAPDDPIAQDELFGPVLAVIKARDFDHALEIAHGTAYALTGGVFSRSPAHIARARTEYRVGNLYINRSITGAIVGRQPFGGFAMSGGGTKAGGPDYLLQCLNPRTITENTQRRGFVPESS